MPRYNIQEKDPDRYAKVKAEQEQLRAECARNSSMTMARLCPYCEHKIEILLRGIHGYSFLNAPTAVSRLDSRPSPSAWHDLLLKTE